MVLLQSILSQKTGNSLPSLSRNAKSPLLQHPLHFDRPSKPLSAHPTGQYSLIISGSLPYTTASRAMGPGRAVPCRLLPSSVGSPDTYPGQDARSVRPRPAASPDTCRMVSSTDNAALSSPNPAYPATDHELKRLSDMSPASRNPLTPINLWTVPGFAARTPSMPLLPLYPASPWYSAMNLSISFS